MNPQRYSSMRDIYHAVCDLPADEQAIRLAALCGDDRDLRAALEALLHEDVDRDPLGDDRVGLGLALARQSLPEDIGGYRIIRQLGQGGMALVFEAEQDMPHRRIALKVMKAGLLSADAVRQFEREANVLGLLQHPRIAQIFAAGSDAVSLDGDKAVELPYLAMELIHGRHLIEFATTRRLSLHDRLHLFCDLCGAVQHAHQRGVVHRDLKPSNILVTADGVVKVLDFGIAQLTNADLHGVATSQDSSWRLGTLGYMSPEQLTADPMQIDTRSDVYSLGVILHEMLSGELPIDVRYDSLAEAARRIREETPASLHTLPVRYRGDLAAIVERALRKDKEERYASAGELGTDVRRCLNDEPIVARPTTARYLLNKFAYRHRALVIGITSTAAALIIGTVVSTYGFVQARAERDESEAITSFLEDTISAVDPYVSGRDMTRQEMLDGTAAYIDIHFDGRPEVRARLHQLVGETYFGLAQLPDAERHLLTAWTLWEERHGDSDPSTLEAMWLLSLVYVEELRYDDARDLTERALSRARRSLPGDDPLRLELMNAHAESLRYAGEYQQAEAILRSVVKTTMRDPETHGTALQFAQLELGMVIFERTGVTEEAESLFRAASTALLDEYGRLDLDRCTADTCLATYLVDAGRFGEAGKLLDDVIDVQAGIMNDHADRAYAMLEQCRRMVLLDQVADGDALSLQAVQLRQNTYGPEHGLVAEALAYRARVLARLGRHDEAEAMANTATEMMRAATGDDTDDLALVLEDYARVLIEAGKAADAAPIARDADRIMRRYFPETDRMVIAARETAAETRLATGQTDGLATEVDVIIANHRTRYGPEHWMVWRATMTLGCVRVHDGEWSAAVALLENATEGLRTTLGDDHTLARKAEGKLRMARDRAAHPSPDETISQPQVQTDTG